LKVVTGDISGAASAPDPGDPGQGLAGAIMVGVAAVA
jgi:hypothetical protein